MSPSVPVKAIKIPMSGAHAGARTDTPHHHPRTRADPQAHNIHEMDTLIHVSSIVRNEQSLAMLSTIDGQQYRIAANEISCRHSMLTQQALEFDAVFSMHYTDTFEELLHCLRAWATPQCPTKKSPGDHVDGGWSIVIHHTVQPTKTKRHHR